MPEIFNVLSPHAFVWEQRINLINTDLGSLVETFLVSKSTIYFSSLHGNCQLID